MFCNPMSWAIWMNQKTWQRAAVTICVMVILQISCGQQYSQVELDGHSMEPNFFDGQMFDIEEVPLFELKRGDLVFINSNGYIGVKRLIGLPDDTIAVHDGNVFVNGTLLVEPYEVIQPTYTVEEIKLGVNSYFVLGDNRPDSVDSHLWGPIKGEDIKGKAIP